MAFKSYRVSNNVTKRLPGMSRMSHLGSPSSQRNRRSSSSRLAWRWNRFTARMHMYFATLLRRFSDKRREQNYER